MENFEVTDKETGKKYWISRSVAIMALVLVEDEPNGPLHFENRMFDGGYSIHPNSNYVHNLYVAVNQRGQGTPDYQGCWNIPVGYLNWDESLKDACTRELMEEQGLYIAPEKWNIWDTNPYDDEFVEGKIPQNITIRFRVKLTMDEYKKALSEGEARSKKYKGEKNEVENKELMLLTPAEIEKKGWAFNHKSLLLREIER